jgi:hypothetical protein
VDDLANRTAPLLATSPHALTAAVAPTLTLTAVSLSLSLSRQVRVRLEPGGPRNTVSFREPWDLGAGFGRLTVFEHVRDCKVCEGLYTHFPLPNGKLAHIYDRGETRTHTTAMVANRTVGIRVGDDR